MKKYGPEMVKIMEGMDVSVIPGLTRDPSTSGFLPPQE